MRGNKFLILSSVVAGLFISAFIQSRIQGRMSARLENIEAHINSAQQPQERHLFAAMEDLTEWEFWDADTAISILSSGKYKVLTTYYRSK